MFVHKKKIRVRYGETDKMGYVYYGNYALYFEEGRTEAIRDLGVSYKSLEEKGVLLPVTTLNTKFLKPAYYDDLLTIETSINEIPAGVRIHFYYKIFNENEELLCTGNTTLAFIDEKTNKPLKAPDFFLLKLKPFFD
ncbi:MAG: acyl-CoA thioesterase [Chitinophagaceae bacterium]|nr:MAG: acyl-CoA thioesterase [Chitinophagaceae bacterium]